MMAALAWIRSRGTMLGQRGLGRVLRRDVTVSVRYDPPRLEAPAAPLALPAPSFRSGFSANRPVVDRDDLFGRGDELERLLGWTIGQRGSALLYGPRGYGKTSVARVTGEIADSRGHLVVYASCSRQSDFTQLLKHYLRELADVPADLLAAETLSVHQVADALAATNHHSVLFILDEYDRIERDDTRQNIIELIKDSADLNAPVQFLLVGVANDADQILGYHPSVNRCFTCVPLTRLTDDAIETLFREKAAADQIDVSKPLLKQIVKLCAGSPYHAQLIGQKLVSFSRHASDPKITAVMLSLALRDILQDGQRIDRSLNLLSREYLGNGEARAALQKLVQAAVEDMDDTIRPHIFAEEMLARYAQTLRGAGILEATAAKDGFRFANPFAPQMLLALDHLGGASLPAR